MKVSTALRRQYAGIARYVREDNYGVPDPTYTAQRAMEDFLCGREPNDPDDDFGSWSIIPALLAGKVLEACVSGGRRRYVHAENVEADLLHGIDVIGTGCFRGPVTGTDASDGGQLVYEDDRFRLVEVEDTDANDSRTAVVWTTRLFNRCTGKPVPGTRRWNFDMDRAVWESWHSVDHAQDDEDLRDMLQAAARACPEDPYASAGRQEGEPVWAAWARSAARVDAVQRRAAHMREEVDRRKAITRERGAL